MASGMTKTQLVRHLAESLETNNKAAAAFLETLADTAIKETKKNGIFVVPGIGRSGEGASQSPRGTQSANRRTHSDQGQDRGEIPRSQGCKGCHRSEESIVLSRSEEAGCKAGPYHFEGLGSCFTSRIHSSLRLRPSSRT